MAKISEKDLKDIVVMRKFGVLVDVDPQRMRQEDGVICVTCADGDQMPDVFQQQVKFALEAGFKPRPHQLSLNGGALLIPEESPLNKELREDATLLAHIRGGIKLKGIRTIVLYIHAPCGAAGLAGLTFKESIDLLIKAKDRIKKEILDVRVACFCHVDREHGTGHKKRTYFVDEERWETLKRKGAVVTEKR
ncbi:MAG: hypothetical protein Q7S09_01250 [bacterium]|nr:hypothetical protein [bacterium]